MSDPSPPVAEPGNLRLLRILVTVLTVVMIAGFLVIVGLIVIRFSSAFAPASIPAATLPASITLPAGTTATAFTAGPGWYAVVTADNRILIYDATSGALRQSIALELGQ